MAKREVDVLHTRIVEVNMDYDARIPKRLRKEPLIEAVWQVVFDPPPEVPVGDLLPGLLFARRRETEPDLRLARLPAADLPAQFAALEPGLRAVARFRLESPHSPFLVQVGERIVTLNCRKPYSGWAEFKRRALELIDQLEASGVIGEPKQHSLRYIDLLALQAAPSIESIQLPLTLGGRSLMTAPLQLRVEVPDDGCLHVVQVVTPAEVQLADEKMSGTLIDLDSIAMAGPRSWDGVRSELDGLHAASKRMFFKQVLRPEAVAALGPEYDDA